MDVVSVGVAQQRLHLHACFLGGHLKHAGVVLGLIEHRADLLRADLVGEIGQLPGAGLSSRRLNDYTDDLQAVPLGEIGEGVVEGDQLAPLRRYRLHGCRRLLVQRIQFLQVGGGIRLGR